MQGSAKLWCDFELDAVEGPDDLDARLELAIETAPASAAAPARLAAALGIGAAELRRRAGVPVAPIAATSEDQLLILRELRGVPLAQAVRKRGDDNVANMTCTF